MEIITIKVSKLKANKENPRSISKKDFEKLVESIKNFPEMLNARPPVIDENFIILGGNQRLKAIKKAGLKEIKVCQVKNWSENQKKEFIVKDNTSSGDWDWDILANEWDIKNLSDWGVNIPNVFSGEEINNEKEYLLENDLWFLNIEFESEKNAKKWYEKLKKENLNIKIIQ